MTINKNSAEQINVALLDLENKIKRSNQTAAISALVNDIELINKTLKEKQNGLVSGETYDINISGNAATSNHSLTADNATTADSANTATDAGHANNAEYADHANTANYAAHADSADSAGSAPIVFPEGFVYIQLYNPTTFTWEKTPAQMGMQVPSGYKWTEITANFSSYPYLKIGNKTTQDGHNAYHRHTHYHTHKHSHTAYTGCYPTSKEANGYGLGGQPGFQNRVMVSSPNNVGTSEDATEPSTIYTSYNGNSDEQTVEVNASGTKIWKVVVD